MNGPVKCAMYRLKPPYSIPDIIELPNNMYKLKKFSEVGEESRDVGQVLEDKLNDGDIQNLEIRWDRVLEQLAGLKAQLADIRKAVGPVKSKPVAAKLNVDSNIQQLKNAVINADPAKPPFSLILLNRIFKDEFNFSFSCHVHSTVVSALPASAAAFSATTSSVAVPTLNITLIWKAGLVDTELIIDPAKRTSIRGEVNILRHLARMGLRALNYDIDANTQARNDMVLDVCHRFRYVESANEKKQCIDSLNSQLGKNSYFGGNDINISDVAAWSTLKQCTEVKELGANLANWFKRIEKV